MKNNSFMKNVLLLVTLFACFFGKAQTGLWGAEVSRDRKHAEVSGLISKQYAAKELAGENLVPEAKMTPFAEAKGDVIYQEDFESNMILNMGQCLSIPFILAGIYFVWRALKRQTGKIIS